MMRPAGVEQALLVVRLSFAHMLLAVYLHGSAVADSLRPNDMLVVVDRSTTYG